MTDPAQVVVSILLMALGYAYFMWRRSGEPFSPPKVAPTIVIGLGVSIFAWWAGTTFDAAMLTLQATPIWGFLVALADQAQGQVAAWWKRHGVPIPPPPPG